MLIQEYGNSFSVDVPETITEESPSISPTIGKQSNGNGATSKVKRTPKDIYRIPQESTPLLDRDPEEESYDGPLIQDVSGYDDEDDGDQGATIVTVAIYINLAANVVLLAAKIVVILLTSSLSVLASLVDGVLDFLSTAIIFTTNRMMQAKDDYRYPVGRRRLEPLGILIFSVIMITSFFQVLIQCFDRLTSRDHSVVMLGIPSIVIMASTVAVKAGCYFWCRFIRNSNVQALAQDAMTDMIFNTFSIIFPLSK